MNLTGRSDSFTQSWLLHRKSVLPSMASEVSLNIKPSLKFTGGAHLKVLENERQWVEAAVSVAAAGFPSKEMKSWKAHL